MAAAKTTFGAVLLMLLAWATLLHGAAVGGSVLHRSDAGVVHDEVKPLVVDANRNVCNATEGESCPSLFEGEAEPAAEAQLAAKDGEVSSGHGYDSDSMSEKWTSFLTDIAQYALEVHTYLEDVRNHATSWSDLAKEWSFHTQSLPPYNALLPTSPHAADKYTDDVSAYAAALSSFASGFAVTAEETAEYGQEFINHSNDLKLKPSGWGDAKSLASFVNQLTSSISYLSTYSSDLSTYTSAWFDNVEFLASKHANRTDTSYDVEENAAYLKTYADDVAAFAADWSRHANDMDSWTADWTQYGENYGIGAL